MSGEYKCSANNIAGRKFRTFRVNIIDPTTTGLTTTTQRASIAPVTVSKKVITIVTTETSPIITPEVENVEGNIQNAGEDKLEQEMLPGLSADNTDSMDDINHGDIIEENPTQAEIEGTTGLDNVEENSVKGMAEDVTTKPVYMSTIGIFAPEFTEEHAVVFEEPSLNNFEGAPHAQFSTPSAPQINPAISSPKFGNEHIEVKPDLIESDLTATEGTNSVSSDDEEPPTVAVIQPTRKQVDTVETTQTDSDLYENTTIAKTTITSKPILRRKPRVRRPIVFQREFR